MVEIGGREFVVKTASRERQKLKLSISGASGSGKTYSSLLLARGIVGPKGTILVIDTENASAELYDFLTEFEHLRIDPPYTPELFISMVEYAVENKYDIVVIDSLSKFWNGSGGMLEEVDRYQRRLGNSYGAWGEQGVGPTYKHWLDTILFSDIHMIATMRSKSEYRVDSTKTGDGKEKIVGITKIGTKPIMREGLEYEFTTALNLFNDGKEIYAQSNKDRTGMFQDRSVTPTVALGAEMRAWLDKGVITSKPEDHGDKIAPKRREKTTVKKQSITTEPPGDNCDDGFF